VALSKEKEKEEEKDKEEEKKKKKKTRQDDNGADGDDGDGDDVASQLPCLSSVVFLSVCLFLSVFLLIAVHSHRSSIVASLPPRSKAPAQPSRAPWLSPRHLGETETAIEMAIDRHEERKIDGAFVLFMFIYKKDTPN